MSQEIRALTKLLWGTIPEAHCFHALSFSWRTSLEVLEEAREIKGSKSWPHSLHAGRMKGDGGMPEGKWGTRQKCRWKVGEEGISGLMVERVLAAISSVQSFSCVRFFATRWIAARQASLSITNSWSLPKPMTIKSVMPSIHLILCRPLLLPPIPPSIRVFSKESTFRMRWPKY